MIAGPLLGLAALASPACAASAPQARLVHCDAGTCLRITGTRPSAETGVLIGGRAIAVEGGRAWRATVPVATARQLATPSGGALHYAFAGTGGEPVAVGEVLLPPGALGRRVELAALIVRAH